jgi:hypothetical protein
MRQRKRPQDLSHEAFEAPPFRGRLKVMASFVFLGAKA